ncbi:MAG: hypothetical protein PF572_04990 [Patescibacteria group bacterium]|jgi:hypothetical protein|nr:hypothetical protein [Patescibacteria group bacterium]
MKKYLFIIILSLFFSSAVLAQEDSLKMTLTPPLIKNNMNPGERWLSTVKLVNNNKEKLVVYTDIKDFRSSTEGGVELISNEESEGEGSKSGFLRQWMDIQDGPFEIAPYGSVEIPFEIEVPETAEPGGHYAAVLVGTKPNEDIYGSGLSISSMISSLILVNISGDVIEEGKIREFSTNKTYYKEPKVNFKLRFENTGNVHLQPKGNIVIKDMFGNEKDVIDINKDTAYGNVLPKSTKSWDFSWEGESGIFKMGKYNAVITVHYGEQTTEVDTRTFYFWYIDFKIVSIVLGSILGFLLLIFLMIKFYIRKTIRQNQKEIERIKAQHPSISSGQAGEEKITQTPMKKKNNRSDVVDLKEIINNSSTNSEQEKNK